MTFTETVRARPLVGIVFLLTFANFWVSWYVGSNKDRFALLHQDSLYTYPIKYRGGVIYFFTPALGQYLEWSFVSHFVALALLAGLSWYSARRERGRRLTSRCTGRQPLHHFPESYTSARPVGAGER